MKEKKIEKKRVNYWYYFWIIVAIFLFFNIHSKINNLEDDVFYLELDNSNNLNDIQILERQTDCLNDYIDDLQAMLKKNPDYVTGKNVDGAISIYFPRPLC